MPDAFAEGKVRDRFAEDGADCSEDVADTESCWFSIDSGEVTVESGDASDAGAVTTSSLTALGVAVVSSTASVREVRSRVVVVSAAAAVPEVRSRVAVLSVGSGADPLRVSSPPTTARFAPACDAGRAESEVELGGESDADDPDDRGVDGDADDFAEPKDRDVDADSDDADELAERAPEEEASEDADEPSEADFDSFGAAEATPCPPNTATPRPSATARPPTRPTYAAAFISFFFIGMLRDRTNTNAVTDTSVEQGHTDNRQITDRAQHIK